MHLTILKALKRCRPCLSQLSLCFPKEISLPLSNVKPMTTNHSKTTNTFDLRWLIAWVGVRGGGDGDTIIYSSELTSLADKESFDLQLRAQN